MVFISNVVFLNMMSIVCEIFFYEKINLIKYIILDLIDCSVYINLYIYIYELLLLIDFNG